MNPTPRRGRFSACDNASHFAATLADATALLMDRVRSCVLVASLMAALPALALGPGPDMVRGDLRIEFSHPSDWRCANDRGCVVCVNIADEPSDVVVLAPIFSTPLP